MQKLGWTRTLRVRRDRHNGKSIHTTAEAQSVARFLGNVVEAIALSGAA
jgi:hypothetical protein